MLLPSLCPAFPSTIYHLGTTRMNHLQSFYLPAQLLCTHCKQNATSLLYEIFVGSRKGLVRIYPRGSKVWQVNQHHNVGSRKGFVDSCFLGPHAHRLHQRHRADGGSRFECSCLLPVTKGTTISWRYQSYRDLRAPSEPPLMNISHPVDPSSLLPVDIPHPGIGMA